MRKKRFYRRVYLQVGTSPFCGGALRARGFGGGKERAAMDAPHRSSKEGDIYYHDAHVR